MLHNEELVAAVLGHIDSLRDLLRCSAVSSRWRSTAKILRPTSIEIPGKLSEGDHLYFDDIPQWLQQKHQQKYFDKLQNLTLSLFDPAIVVRDLRPLTACGQAILMLAGLWPLKACSIDGPFSLYQIAGLLPQTLHHLQVKTYEEYDNIDICIFQRFRNLRSLDLSAAEDYQVDGSHMQFAGVLPNLRHLHLSPRPFKDNGTLASSLPQLTHAALYVHANELEQYVKLPHIECLSLQLVSLEPVQVKMKVDADSHLNCLVLRVPENVQVDLCLDKPDLLYAIHGTSATSGIRSVCSSARVYQLPTHFKPP